MSRLLRNLIGLVLVQFVVLRATSIDVTVAEGLEAAIDYANQGNADTLVLVESGPYFIGPVEINSPITFIAGSNLTTAPSIVAAEGTDVNDFIKINNDLTLDGVVVDGKYGDCETCYAKIKYMLKIPNTEDEGSPNVAPDLIIRNSVLQNVYKLGTTENAADGTAIDWSTGGRAGVVLIENTLIQNTGDEAIRAQSAYKTDHSDVSTAVHGCHFDSFTIRNVTFANVNGSSIKLNGDMDTLNVSPAVLLENVTTYNCGRRIIWSRDLSDVTIRNFIIHTAKVGGTEYGYDGGQVMYVDMDGSTIANIDTFNLARIVGTDTVTIADTAFVLGGGNKSGSSQTATLDEATVYEYDPDFADAANGDYTLSSSSMVCGLAHDGGALGDSNHAENCSATGSTASIDVTVAEGLEAAIDYANGGNAGTLVLVESGPYFIGPVEINVPLTIIAGSNLTTAPSIVAAEGTDVNDFIKINNDLTLDGVVVDGKYGDCETCYAKIKYMLKIPNTEDEGSPNVAPDLIIRNSVLQNVYKLGTTENAADGTAIDWSTGGRAGVVLIENTLIQNTGDEAIRAQSAYKTDHSDVSTAVHGCHFDSFTIRNVTFANVNGSSIKLNGDMDTLNVSPAVLLENVTTYNCGRRIIWSRDLSDVTIRNFIIHTAKVGGTEYGYDGGQVMYVDMDGSTIANIDTFNLARIVGTDTVTIADTAFVLGGGNKSGSSQTATLDEATVYEYDPDFADAANGDYTLSSSSMVCGLAHDGGALGDSNHAGNCATVSIIDDNIPIADGFLLMQNYPNPFNPSTTIRYVLNEDSKRVTLKIFDVKGRLIDVLVNETKDKGFYIARWNPNVSAGIYLYQLTVGEKTVSKKMLLLK